MSWSLFQAEKQWRGVKVLEEDHEDLIFEGLEGTGGQLSDALRSNHQATSITYPVLRDALACLQHTLMYQDEGISQETPQELVNTSENRD